MRNGDKYIFGDNGYGQLVKQYQEANGAVNTSTPWSVAYRYTQTVSGDKDN